MKKMLLALAAAVAVSSTALAADLPVRKAQQLVPQQSEAYYFDGLYVGGHVGWASLNRFPTGIGVDVNGFTYGGHIGYQKQFNWFVVGVEGDVTNFTNVKGKFGGVDRGCDCLVADIIAKVGIVVGRQLLVYGHGGAFWHNAQTFGILPQFGWEAGGGVDWAPFDNHWKIGGRYTYRRLDIANSVGPFKGIDSHEFKVPLSYQF